MVEAFSVWILVIDYVLGMIMWTLVGRAAMNLFLPIDSDFFFMKVFVRATNPINHHRNGRCDPLSDHSNCGIFQLHSQTNRR